MKRSIKAKLIKRLSDDLTRFYPELRDIFICPTCLKRVPISKLSKISVAHIVPKAGGGRLKTFLCRDCNSSFGSSQDKWFGEYAHLARQRLDILESRIQKGYFDIDGLRLRGTYQADRDEGLKFFIHTDRNSPETLRKLYAMRRANRLAGSTLSIPVPLLKNQELLKVGFLTAAYLLWFHEFGYSWVLQKHLDIVRSQIKNPKEEIIKETYAVRCLAGFEEEPWVGVARCQEELLLIAALADSLVTLPAADRPDLPFGNLAQSPGENSVTYRRLDLYQGHHFGGPSALLVEDRFLVLPDVILKSKRRDAFIAFYPSLDTQVPVRMGFIDEDEARALQRRENLTVVEAKYSPWIASQETARTEDDESAK